MQFDDASRALVELAASRHNAFHTSEAADIPTARLRRAEKNGDLVRLHRSVWAVASLGCPAGQASRAATLAVTDSALIHMSSCWLHDWIDRPPNQVQLWMPHRNRRTPGATVTPTWASRIDPALDVTEVRGTRTLNKAATLSLLGRVTDDGFVSRMLDEFLRNESMLWLTTTLARLHRRNDAGTTRLARLLTDPDRIGGVTESPMERILADHLTAAGITGLVTQYPVTVDGRTFRMDLALPDVKLGIEAHSRTFHWSYEQREADNVRDLLLGSSGWKLLYVTWEQMKRPHELTELVRRTVEARRRQLARPA